MGDTATAGVREREKGREEDVTARDRGALVDGNLFSADGFVLFRVVTVGVTDSEICSGNVFLENSAAQHFVL